MVRNFQPLLHVADLELMRPVAGRPVAAPALLDWATEAFASKQFPQTLLALGALRLAKQFDSADELLRTRKPDVPSEWRAGWANEMAALAWQRGRCEEAYTQWQTQSKTVPVLFNRGMAALFLGDQADARAALVDVVRQLPETSAWYHLAQLYLTLAETRKG
jgi:hypothetical protein